MEKAIAGGLKYLKQIQQHNGSFSSLSALSISSYARGIKTETTFACALILGCLVDIKTDTSAAVKNSLYKFLLKQKSHGGSFNYWIKGSVQRKSFPYPDDLDDTFLALSSLVLHDSKSLTGKDWAGILKLLEAQEQKPGGPYHTWITSNKKWEDIDLAVNCNVGYFLRLHEVDLPVLTRMAERSINRNHYSSKYYPNFYPVIYFISRFYSGPKKNKLIRFILSKQKSEVWQNPLYTALMVSALINLGFPKTKLKKSVDYLVKTQTLGAWNAFGFCLDPKIKGTKYYSGSGALTTAFCIEALGKYLKSEKVNIKEDKFYKEVSGKIQAEVTLLPKRLRADTAKSIRYILDLDKDRQIILLPYWFYNSFAGRSKLSRNDLQKIGIASVWGWSAYRIYDDCMDSHSDGLDLSVAGLASRKLVMIYSDIFKSNPGALALFEQIMNTMDSANHWEQKNSRFKIKNKLLSFHKLPNYRSLELIAEKSLGHALAPVAVLLLSGFKPNSAEVKNTIKFLKHYLIARQLNDDAHDWKQDLQLGHINSCTAMLLAQFGKNKLNLDKDIFVLQKLFWHKTIPKIVRLTNTHLRLAEKYLRLLHYINIPEHFLQLLKPIGDATQKADRERNLTIEFLKHY